jgi:hypothetical protein
MLRNMLHFCTTVKMKIDLTPEQLLNNETWHISDTTKSDICYNEARCYTLNAFLVVHLKSSANFRTG